MVRINEGPHYRHYRAHQYGRHEANMEPLIEAEAEQACRCHNCESFADILQGTILASDNNLCVVMRMRDINATIAGRTTVSPLSLAAMFSFESADQQGNTLNLGETVILPDEINPFISALRAQGIEVTALHNHWLFDHPRLMYIHFLSIENPLRFAEKVARAFKVLEPC